MHGRSARANSDIVEIPAQVDLLRLHRLDPDSYPFLLQSTAPERHLGRYDILFAEPGAALELTASGQLAGTLSHGGSGFLDALDDWWKRERVPRAESLVPFSGGWFVFLGYELASEIEPVLDLAADDLLPRALAVRCRAAIVRDRIDERSWLISEAEVAADADRIIADIERVSDAQTSDDAPPDRGGVTEDPPDEFLRAVERAKEYIASGDIYQANLSRSWSRSLDERIDVAALYASLCESNPAPFAGIARWRGTTILSSSPERLVNVRDNLVSTRPIAGTRPRSDDPDIDDQLSTELFSHPKERAEHVMLIDLERNDLGRVCEPGTVEVDEMMVLESYAHVHHIVSNVRGKLRPDVTPGDTIRAVFPGGTITGCPKVRCMQIIAELETGVRGAYTGSFGYLDRDGNMDLNILIRTMVHRQGKLILRAGSGVVADSVPDAELAETRAKAEGMLRSLRP